MGFPITAEEVKAIRRPEDLFPGDAEEARTLYHELAQRWHPDRTGDGDAFSHINWLYDEAMRRIADGTWGGEGVLRFVERAGGAWDIRFLTSKPYELGRMYVGDTHVTFLAEREHRELFDNGAAFTGIFSYANDRMKDEVSRFLPRDVKILHGQDGRTLMRVPKAADQLLLRDVLEHFGGKLDPRHAAWVGSGLHDIACYLRWAGIVHANISPDTVFVSPRAHSSALLGGWWFATKEGKRLRRIPQRTFDYLPWAVRKERKATYLVDLELVRATVRELLGDVGGSGLKDPSELVAWLKLPASGEPVQVYQDWHAALERTWGRRRFVELELEARELYDRR